MSRANGMRGLASNRSKGKGMSGTDAGKQGSMAKRRRAWRLVLAIFFGVTSAEGSPLQLFYSSPGSAAMQHLPWAFVRTVLVPFYLSCMRHLRATAHATGWCRRSKS